MKRKRKINVYLPLLFEICIIIDGDVNGDTWNDFFWKIGLHKTIDSIIIVSTYEFT